MTERSPPRAGCEITPLIDGDDTRRALEKAALDAVFTLDFAFWQFDPALDTLTAFALDPVLHGVLQNASVVAPRTWGMLIIDALARGVEVRVIVSDFDPLLDPELHVDAWSSYYRLVKAVEAAAARTSAVDVARFQMMCPLHPATLHPGALEPLAGDSAAAAALDQEIGDLRIAATVDWFNDLIANQGSRPALNSFDLAPRLWDKLEYDVSAATFKAVTSPPFSYGVASHHVKLVVVDSERALLGGFNINSHIVVSQPAHTLPTRDADVTHDVHCEVRGAVVTDLERFFVGLWNASLDDFTSFLDAANLLAPGEQLPRVALTPMNLPGVFAGSPPGARTAQVVRTVTGQVPPAPPHGKAPPLPEPLALDTQDVYGAAIDAARTYIYIENQYFRWAPIASRLARALRGRPTLQVIVVLPFRPEEVGDPATLHGNAIQFDELSKLVKEFAPRFGLFTLVSPTLPADVEYRKARKVYIHSKILVVDDLFAVVGSANLNGRSVMVDTEVGVAWTGGFSVIEFRKKLWAHALGPQTDQGGASDFVWRWHGRAFRNDIAKPTDRVGFVVHLDVDDLARGLRVDDPLNPAPAVLAPAFDVYS